MRMLYIKSAFVLISILGVSQVVYARDNLFVPAPAKKAARITNTINRSYQPQATRPIPSQPKVRDIPPPVPEQVKVKAPPKAAKPKEEKSSKRFVAIINGAKVSFDNNDNLYTFEKIKKEKQKEEIAGLLSKGKDNIVKGVSGAINQVISPQIPSRSIEPKPAKPGIHNMVPPTGGARVQGSNPNINVNKNPQNTPVNNRKGIKAPPSRAVPNRSVESTPAAINNQQNVHSSIPSRPTMPQSVQRKPAANVVPKVPTPNVNMRNPASRRVSNHNDNK